MARLDNGIVLQPGEEVFRLPINGELDLHAFHPTDIKDLVPDYLELCREKGLHEVRIVHGKGTGTLRETVHALLRQLPYVKQFSLAPADRGHWGATLVTLEPAPEEKHD